MLGSQRFPHQQSQAGFGLQDVSFFLACISVASVAFPNIVLFDNAIGSASQIVIILSTIFTLGVSLFKGYFKLPNTFHILFIVFVVLGLESALWSIDLGSTFYRFFVNMEVLLLLYIIWENTSSLRQWRHLLQAYIYGAWVSALSIMLNYQFDATYLAGLLIDQRYSAFGYDPNDIAVMLALAVPMAWYLGITESKGRGIFFNRIFPLVASLAVLLTASRTGFVALGVSHLFVIWSTPRLNGRGRVLGSVILFGAAAYLISTVPAAVWERLEEGIDSTLALDFTGRGEVWLAGLNVFQTSPLLGTGAGTFPLAVEAVLNFSKAPHNTFISVLTEQGLVGIVIFTLILLLVIQFVVNAPPLERYMGLTLLGTWFIGAMLLGWEYRKPTWLLFGLLAIMHMYCRSEPKPLRSLVQSVSTDPHGSGRYGS